ncbi:NAD(P)-binding protein [Lentinus tigrinus ALCF2SS1-6]|uniref:NAD(P)-binding protein n=1 Tax=Lentinus tigrinus ALCF2SS1-6 TaxID=1328759 RepID=A0A5C2SLZ2_9APHY|nr:NAD(P)-binding protein [Lentinus tigrinus ALCF2SS1-6]
MPSKTSIFLTGATGYIGGAVLARLLNHPSSNTFDIIHPNILLTKFGIKTVVGTHQELDKVESLAEGAHVVINLAEADNVPFMKAILSGLRKRQAKLGDPPLLIHTYKSIPDTAVHRNVDLLVINADIEGYARTYIIPPSTIYGIAKHALVDAGVSNAHSIQIPVIIEASLARKHAGVVGKGKSFWPDVHIDDIADLYIVLYDTIVANPENISKAIGEAMVTLGICTGPEPTPFTKEETEKYFGSEQWGWYSSTNARCRANRARALGWKPKYTTDDMLESIKAEVETIAKKPPFWPSVPTAR